MAAAGQGRAIFLPVLSTLRHPGPSEAPASHTPPGSFTLLGTCGLPRATVAVGEHQLSAGLCPKLLLHPPLPTAAVASSPPRSFTTSSPSSPFHHHTWPPRSPCHRSHPRSPPPQASCPWGLPWACPSSRPSALAFCCAVVLQKQTHKREGTEGLVHAFPLGKTLLKLRPADRVWWEREDFCSNSVMEPGASENEGFSSAILPVHCCSVAPAFLPLAPTRQEL